jgi:hypothetical protein
MTPASFFSCSPDSIGVENEIRLGSKMLVGGVTGGIVDGGDVVGGFTPVVGGVEVGVGAGVVVVVGCGARVVGVLGPGVGSSTSSSPPGTGG